MNGTMLTKMCLPRLNRNREFPKLLISVRTSSAESARMRVSTSEAIPNLPTFAASRMIFQNVHVQLPKDAHLPS
jgi:hypothetical protein